MTNKKEILGCLAPFLFFILIPIAFLFGFFFMPIFEILANQIGFFEPPVAFYILLGFYALWIIMMVLWKKKSPYFRVILTIYLFALLAGSFFNYFVFHA